MLFERPSRAALCLYPPGVIMHTQRWSVCMRVCVFSHGASQLSPSDTRKYTALSFGADLLSSSKKLWSAHTARHAPLVMAASDCYERVAPRLPLLLDVECCTVLSVCVERLFLQGAGLCSSTAARASGACMLGVVLFKDVCQHTNQSWWCCGRMCSCHRHACSCLAHPFHKVLQQIYMS